jgi:Domain of unknown function (DUF4411)
VIYILDSNSLITMGHYFPDVFKSFWDRLDELVDEGRLHSVREVKKELDNGNNREHLAKWAESNSEIFRTPTGEELEHVAEIFRVRNFQHAVRNKQLLRGSPVADPFLVAAAKVHDCYVVTEESRKPNSAQLPNVCDHFDVPCTNLEGLMTSEGWTF